MISVTMIGCLHGHYPELPGGDLLIITGDLTATHTEAEYLRFFQYIAVQDYEKIVFIAGNHDSMLLMPERLEMLFASHDFPKGKYDNNIEYLCDSGTEYQGLKIWGSPGSLWFNGINPRCAAFTGTESDLNTLWKQIPHDTDILITHGPVYSIMDGVEDFFTGKLEPTGSASLLRWMADHDETLKLHVCSHIHQGYGVWDWGDLKKNREDDRSPIFVNCSHMDENYKPTNKPITMNISLKETE